MNGPAQAAGGTSYYVAPNGSDGAPGTLGQPWRTIQHAVDTVNPGDTIYVRSGTYAESVQFRRSGLAGMPITLTNYNGESVTVDGQANPAIVDKSGTQYWTVRDLTLVSTAEFTVLHDAWGCDGTCRGTHHWTIADNRIIGAVSMYGSYNLFESNTVDGSRHTGYESGVWERYDVSHHNIFRNNEVHHFDVRGIWSMHRTHDDIFENNYIHHIGIPSQGGACIDTDGFGTVEWRHVIRGNVLQICGEAAVLIENTYDSVVENNTMIEPGWDGINIVNYGPNIGPGDVKCQAGGENNQYGDTDGNNNCEGDLTGIVIRQNLIYDGTTEAGIAIRHAGGISIWSNTIARQARHGIIIYGVADLSPQIDIQNNVLADTAGPVISVEELDSVTQDHHNLLNRTNSTDVYDARSNWATYSLAEYQAATGRGQGSLQTNPLFLDPAGNFHLRADSPAVDAGVDTGLTEDLDGIPRPLGEAFDIGAYEAVPPGSIFADVPETHWAREFIEALYTAGYVVGCRVPPARLYCPDNVLSRAEIAVFVERGIRGAGYSPDTPTGQAFADVALDSWVAGWVTTLYEDGYTEGCSTGPLMYCPWRGNTRAEASVFFLRMMHGAEYIPPEPSGPVFVDVPLDSWYARWVYAAQAAGLLVPCKTEPLSFCPEGPLNRAWAAYMMVQAKGGLPLP